MKKFLLLAGIFTVLTYNIANARGYYEEDGYYVEETPRYSRYREEPRYERHNVETLHVVYRNEPRYEQRSERYYRDGTPRYTRSAEEPRQYRRLNRADERHYQEREYVRNNTPSNTIRPYIGADIMNSKIKFGKDVKAALDERYDDEAGLKDKFTAGSIVLGARINKNWGVEAFYEISSEEEDKVSQRDEDGKWTESNTVSYKAYGADIQYYIPVNQDFELLASLGLAQYDFENKYKYEYEEIYYMSKETGHEKSSTDSLGIRFGIGGQYYLTDNLALRAMARYVKMNDDDDIKSLTEFSLGLRYMF